MSFHKRKQKKIELVARPADLGNLKNGRGLIWKWDFLADGFVFEKLDWQNLLGSICLRWSVVR